MAHRFPLGNAAALLLFLAGSTADGADFVTLNAAFGIPVWRDENLWDDEDRVVATRLEWSPESRTSDSSSFRRYASADERVLGARPHSLALYGRHGRVDQISMVFANKGDLEVSEGGRRGSGDYRRQILVDARVIREALTKTLGPSNAGRFGQSARTRERVDRWDWNGHAILLAAPRDEYVAVRIVPTAVADGEAQARVTDLALRATLKTRVEHRPNGDVILRDIPMVDQGPKGYCVPATWERALRYLGIPADMYVLAKVGQTDPGGGTTLEAMRAGVAEIVHRNGRRLVTFGGRVTPGVVASHIDEGRPILWAMFVDFDLYLELARRMSVRRHAPWTAYAGSLEEPRRAARRLRANPENGHVCMIIGYNPTTNEIAISDSWGPHFAERWITIEEANAISQGEFTVVNW